MEWTTYYKVNTEYRKFFVVNVQIDLCTRLKMADRKINRKGEKDVMQTFVQDLSRHGFGRCPFKVTLLYSRNEIGVSDAVTQFFLYRNL